jgi:hypothetical protein
MTVDAGEILDALKWLDEFYASSDGLQRAKAHHPSRGFKFSTHVTLGGGGAGGAGGACVAAFGVTSTVAGNEMTSPHLKLTL